jgi:uncharacterized glyoxalase superfamily protein PhnB
MKVLKSAVPVGTRRRAAYGKALGAGAVSQAAPEDKPYGHRSAGVVDQNGIMWWIGSPIK